MGEGEPPADYVTRRNLLASRIAGRAGRWYTHWFRKSLSWHRHLERQRDHESWAVQIASYRGEHWLEATRALSGTNRPGTRVAVGPPRRRWREGIAIARSEIGSSL